MTDIFREKKNRKYFKKIILCLNMKKGWFIFLIFVFIFMTGSTNANISNVSTEPLYPNLSSKLVMVHAKIDNNESGINTILHYRLSDFPNIPFLSLFVGDYAVIYGNPKDNSVVNYQIEVINSSGTIENTIWFNFTYDGTPPVITILGDNPANAEIGSNYTDAGATASDSIYGDLTSNIITNGSINTSAIGEYKIDYTVSDPAGNTATATRTVNVIETSPVVASSGSSGGSGSGNYYSSSSEENIPVINKNNKKSTNNSEGNPNSAGVTGKSVIELIGENKGISLVIGIVIFIIAIAFYFIKKEIKRKLYGKKGK